MRIGKSKDAWEHTSTVLCFLANPHRDSDKHPQPFTPDDFNPHSERKTASKETYHIGLLKKAFIDKRV